MLLVLLMTVSVIVACNDKQKNDDHKETQRETEQETEKKPDQQLTDEEREQLKVQMSESILQALSGVEQSTERETQDQTTSAPSEDTTSSDYGSFVDGLLGSLGGLGNGDYDYFAVIMEVLNQYIGSNSTSEFILGLIQAWLEDMLAQGIPTKGTEAPEQTEVEPEQPDGETEETVETEADVALPEDAWQDLQEYIAVSTANAVADTVTARLQTLTDHKLNDMIYESIRESVYDSVYEAMIDDQGYMDSLLNEIIPGYGQLSGILGGFGQ